MSFNLGIVIIGRNEGERLRACFDSIEQHELPTVYVDSGSTDDSVELAKQYQATVVELDMSVPFSAARARNMGYQKLLEEKPQTSHIQFIDGDCELTKDWIAAARRAFSGNPRLAVVVGHLLEKFPDKTLYNKLCALEWRSPPGQISDGGFGGISMIRSSVLVELGGFNPLAIVGEEAELGGRIIIAGDQIEKIEHVMAKHDANMTTFRQWWKRATRGGQAIGYRFDLGGQDTPAEVKHEKRRTLFWGFFLPAIIILGLIPTRGLSLLLSSGYILLGYRVYKGRKRMGDSSQDAKLYAHYNLLSNFACLVGLVRHNLNKKTGKSGFVDYRNDAAG